MFEIVVMAVVGVVVVIGVVVAVVVVKEEEVQQRASKQQERQRRYGDGDRGNLMRGGRLLDFPRSHGSAALVLTGARKVSEAI